jgi:hypothetical protein
MIKSNGHKCDWSGTLCNTSTVDEIAPEIRAQACFNKLIAKPI